MIEAAFRFAGVAVVFVAGGLACSPLARAQTVVPRNPVLFDAAMRSGVSGVVRDRTGKPQIGAVVEVLNGQYALVARTFTDDRGRYSLPHLSAGMYQVKATSSLLLPAIRPDLRLLANSKAVVNLTLSNLYQALDWLPAEPRAANSPSDEWDWTLRLSTNRPLLRVLPPEIAQMAAAHGILDVQGPVLVEGGATPVRAASRETVRTGLRRFGEGGLTEQLQWSPEEAQEQAIVLGAEIGAERLGGSAAYRQELAPDRTLTTIASYTERPGVRSSAGAGLQTARVRSASTVKLGELAEISAGTELAAARLGRTAIAVESHPFAKLTVRGGKGVAVEYRVASAVTATEADALEREAGEDAPALVASGGRLRMEGGLHQEVRVTRRTGKWTGEIGLFDDELRHPMVQGFVRGDEASIDSNDVLLDPETGIIAVSGRGYSHGGVMALLHDQLSPDTWLTLRFAMGEAVTAPPFGAGLAAFGAKNTPSASVSAGMRLPGSNTAVRGSYRWQPVSTVTGVTPFATGGPDAYLGFSVRQPLHLKRVGDRAGATRMEAVLDVRNLLAQGYRPFLSEDGTTVFFAQAQRTIAAGLSFSF